MSQKKTKKATDEIAEPSTGLDLAKEVRVVQEPVPAVSQTELNEAFDKEYGWLSKDNLTATLRCVLRELVWARLWREQHG